MKKNTIYPNCELEKEEQKLYKIRLAEHAGGRTIKEYVANSNDRYVILSNANQPQHWINNADPTDETDWVFFQSREDAEKERQSLIKQKDYGHRVVTERYFLKLKGLI